MGGTFMSLPADYRDFFVRGLHDALSGHASSSCAEAVAFAEQSATRCIGLTIETRPDYCQGAHLQQVFGLPLACRVARDCCRPHRELLMLVVQACRCGQCGADQGQGAPGCRFACMQQTI